MAVNPSMGCSVPNMVQRYLGTEYDTVKRLADNLEALLKLASYLETSVIQIPTGTSAERPATALEGMFRYNTDHKEFEGYSAEGWGQIGTEQTHTYSVVPRCIADGSTNVFDIGKTAYVSEYRFFVFKDTMFQRPYVDFTIGADEGANAGKLILTTTPPAGTVIDVIALRPMSEAIQNIVVISDAVPSISSSANWFINNTTGRVYCKVTGVNGTYWVESNSSGRL